MFGLVRWHGRTHVEISQVWRKARLPIELMNNPPRWLLRKNLLTRWELPFGRFALWRLTESEKEALVAKVGQQIATRGDAFEVER
jgi:hypothetical protein